MDRISRKELKKDKFREELASTVEYVGLHRQQMVRYGAVVVALVLAVLGWRYYSKQKSAEREGALQAAMDVQNRQIGPETGNEFLPTFPTVEARANAANKAFNDVIAKYPGSDEAQIAYYFLGVAANDTGKTTDAEKYFKVASEDGSREYGSLAKYSLAHVEYALGKPAEGERLLRSLIEKPTIFVSKDQASLSLAKLIAPTRPNEARKLVEPLMTSKNPAVSRAALTAMSEFSQQ
ncbi:MAG: tetratricopeptide repeat protein [Acidobacteriales bacterium]|nr:tetratricopeptide repeat protein [Terriglobales bacterium]